MTHPCEAHLAPYAARAADSPGRAHAEPEDPLRCLFGFDRHRIIESTAFRRLEGKTQVFLASHHDHFRTRLTHTLEAAEIARTLAAGLQANEHLAEAITLAHDLGHPPFGHAGEVALDEAMSDHGGFNHNLHSLRVVEYLEHPFPAFRGLNLTGETRAGLAAHETRYDRPEPGEWSGGIRAHSSVEAQIASVADRIAYNCHDLEDAIGAGFIGLEDIEAVSMWTESREAVEPHPGEGPIHAIRRAVLDTLLGRFLVDVITASQARLAPIGSIEKVRKTPEPLCAPSSKGAGQLAELEAFLLDKLYRRPEVNRMDAAGRRIVRSLFAAYLKNPSSLPRRFADRVAEQGQHRVICDYLAGMTDRFCRAVFDEGAAHRDRG